MTTDLADGPARTGRAKSRSMLGSGTAPVIALTLYLAGAVITQLHGLAHMGSGCACYGTDPTLFIWSLAWWPHAIGELPHNPFITHEIWAPGGLNLAVNSSVPTLGLLGAPITLIFGPVVTYNVMSLLAPITGAFMAYRLCLALTERELPSIAGGWLYGFSTYALTELMGHLHLVFTFAAPALVLLVLRRLDGTIGRWRMVILMAVVVALQLGISTEMLLTVSVSGAILFVSVLIFAPTSHRLRLLRTLPEIVGAYVVAGIVTSPFIYYAVSGPPQAVGRGADQGADLLSFIVPPVSAWLGGTAYAHISTRFLTDPAETNAYLGFPLIAIFLATCGRLLRDWRVRALVLAVLVLTLWSLGTHLEVQGVTHVALPFNWLASHRFFDQILPVRISAYIALGTAVAAAMWLSWRRVFWPLRWALALAAAVFIFPDLGAPEYNTRYVVPRFFTSGTYRRYIKPHEVVLPLPFADTGNSLVWQARTHFRFALASGNFTQPAPPEYQAQPATTALITLVQAVPKDDDAVVRQFLIRQHVGAAVIQDGTSPGWADVFNSLGGRGVSTGGVEIFQFRAPL